MEKKKVFAMCRKSQLNHLRRWRGKNITCPEAQEDPDFKRWVNLLQLINENGWLEEYEKWYIGQQEMAVAAWNTRELQRQQEARGKTNVQESN